MTISVLVVTAVAVYIGLPYSNVLGVIYIALSSALACRVFRMLVLCRWDREDTDLSTRDVELMLMAVTSGPEGRAVAAELSEAGHDV